MDLWKTHRKVLLPVFHNKIIEEYLGVIAEQAQVLVQRLEERVGGGEFDVLKYVTAATLDIVFGRYYVMCVYMQIQVQVTCVSTPDPYLLYDLYKLLYVNT